MDIRKKITITLTEDDVKQMIAEYITNCTRYGQVKKENVELSYGIQVIGPQYDPTNKAYLRECKISFKEE